MPIVVACPCGAKLRAPDHAAGKRVKCPKCATALAVPAPEADYVEVEDDLSPPAPTPAKRKPQVVEDDEDAPRPARKAAAKSKPDPVEVDEPVDDDEDEAPKKKKKRRDDDDDEDDDAPKKTKGKRRMGKNREEEKKKKLIRLILGISGAVVALGVVIGVIVVATSMINNDPAKAGLGTLPTTPPPPPPPPPGWSTFKGDGFSVAVPDEIQFKKQDRPPNAGGPQGPTSDGQSYSNGAPPQPGQPLVMYLVNTGPLPPEVKAEFAKSSQAGWEAIKKTDKTSQLQNEKAIQMSGVEGRQFTMNLGVGSALVRMVVKGDRGYVVMVMAQAAPADDDPKLKPFFDSFKID